MKTPVQERIGRALSGEYVYILGTNDWPECNGLCAQLAKLAYVPEPGVIKFYDRAKALILTAACEHSLTDTQEAIIKELEGFADDARRLRARLARFRGAVERSDLSSRDLWHVAQERIDGRTASGEYVGMPITPMLLPLLAAVAENAKAARAVFAGKHNKNNGAHKLIVQLQAKAMGYGGKGFTYDKNVGRGSLIEAIELLVPLFPDRFFPEEPTSTYQRDLDVGRRIGRAIAAAYARPVEHWTK